MAHAAPQPGSPGTRSDVSTPTKRLVGGVLSLSPFKRGGGGGGGGGLSSTGGGGGGGGGSPYGSEGGASAGSGQRSLIPSYSHAVQKREVIRQQEEALGMLRLQAQQQGAEIGRLQSALTSEREGGAALQERLNMQYFKSSLLVDILVTKLLEGRQAAAAAVAAQQLQQQQHMHQAQGEAQPQQNASSSGTDGGGAGDGGGEGE